MEESLIFQGIKVEQKEKNSDLEKRILNVVQEELKLIKLIALALQRVTNKILSFFFLFVNFSFSGT